MSTTPRRVAAASRLVRPGDEVRIKVLPAKQGGRRIRLIVEDPHGLLGGIEFDSEGKAEILREFQGR